MGNPDFMEALNSYVSKAVKAQRDALEEMCWRSLDPQTNPHGYGILVEETYTSFSAVSEDNTYKVGCDVTITLSPDVPFGEIHYKKGEIR